MTTTTSGPLVFARYAYPPNALGYCGGDDPAALVDAASRQPNLDGLHRLASRFEGAWPYLQLIAACNHIPDPLDWRVTSAYWVGNSLLDHVPQQVLAASLDERFSGRLGRHHVPIAEAIPNGAVPHHSFHVFAVYPWLDLLRRGREDPALRVLDRCRIRWGVVEAVRADCVITRCSTLRFDGSHLALGGEQVEENRMSLDGVGLIEDLRPGDTVSLHWDWVCDRLSPQDLARLQYYTDRNLNAVNGLPQPDPPAFCDASA